MRAAGDITWAVASADQVPDGDDWLGPREREVLAGLRFGPRRASWRLGRLAAKRLLGDVEILPSPEGPPSAWRGGVRLPVSLSISHRDGLGVCAALPGAVAIGFDIERVEPRSAALVADFFTAAEQAAVAAALDPALLANLVWSAKESALKALHVGLRRDTRELDVRVGASGALAVTDLPAGRLFHGRWRRLGAHVLTLVTEGRHPDLIERFPQPVAQRSRRRRSTTSLPWS